MNEEIIKTDRKIATAKILEQKFNEYLKSIRCRVPVMREISKDEQVPAVDEDGNQIYSYEYYLHPTQLNFCMFLGIDKRTWWRYCDPSMHPDLHEVTSKIKSFCEAYLQNAALSGSCNHNFVVFDLTNNYGWKDQKEVELGKKTREAVQLNTLSPREKMEKLKALKNLTLPGDSE